MAKSIREEDNQKEGRREGGEQFDTDHSHEGDEVHTANEEEVKKETTPETPNESKGTMGSGQRQDAN